MKAEIIGQEIHYFDSIDSTNTYATKIARNSKEGCVVISEEQTRGRGRLGRTWVSKKKQGLYLTLILKPKIDIKRVSFLTQVCAAALVKSLKEVGISTLIKWPNDIILNNKKLAGILTELDIGLRGLNHVLVGIGINLLQEEFEEELEKKATSLKKEGYKLDKEEFLNIFFYNFETLYIGFLNGDNEPCLEILRRESAVIGREVFLIDSDKKEKVVVDTIDDFGNLIVICEGGEKKKVFTGEISLRGLNSYI